LRGLWKRRWLLTVLALVIFLSVGAVAWAAGNDDGRPASDPQVAADVADVKVLTAAGGPGPLTREAVKEKRQQWAERRKAMLELVKEKMSAEDQAAYERLVKTAEEQRETLKQAREALRSTLEELRDLTDKYLGLGGEPAGSVGTAPTTD
jgi:ABC-type transporter Mla subunit MlaD